MTLQDRVTAFSIERPRWVFAILLLICSIATFQIPSIKVDTDPENMLPHDQADRLYHDQVKAKFSLYDMVVVGLVDDHSIYRPERLADLHRLSDAIAAMDGVIVQDLMALDRVDNISQAGPGTIRFEWMMKSAPTTQEQAEAIQSSVARLPLLNNTLVSADGKATAIYVPVVSKAESYRLSQQIQAVIDTLETPQNYYIAGLPVAEDTFGVEMFLQMAVSAPLAGLMIFILMWLFFRSLLLVSAAMLVAMASVIITMGLLIGQGYTVHIMSSMIPIFLMPIAVVDSVHILSEFADRYRPGDDPRAALKEVVGHLFTPMLYTSVTSAVGFASLAFTPIPPVQIFGLHVAFGILLAFVVTVTLVPAFIVSLKPARLAALKDYRLDRSEQGGVLGRILDGAGKFSRQQARGLILFFSALVVVSVWGVSQIQINDNPVRWFKEDHRLRVADRVMNEHFPGTYDAFLVLEKPITDPERNRLEQELNRLATQAGLKDALDELRSKAASDNYETYLDNLISALDEASYTGSAEQEQSWLAMLTQVEQQQMESRYFLTPEALNWLNDLHVWLNDSDYVGKANGLPVLLKTVYRELNGGSDEFYRLPPTAAAAAQTILSFQGSHRPDDLWHMVTRDYRSTNLWLQLRSGDNQDMSRVVEQVEQYIADHPLPQGVEMHWAGLSWINVVWQQQMVNGMLNSLLSAFITVLVMMVLLFRSVKIGLLAMLPLTVTILFIYGVIGLVGKDYDMPIAVLSALTLGLSVDFAIHLLERARAIYRETGNWPDAVSQLYQGPARAISRNAVVVAVGFTPLLVAPLVPYITVGFFLATIMAVSAVVTLILLPAVIDRIKAKDALFGVSKEKQNV